MTEEYIKKAGGSEFIDSGPPAFYVFNVTCSEQQVDSRD